MGLGGEGPGGEEPVVPDYAGACVSRLAPALLGLTGDEWLPAAARGARQVVLLVLDGLGWHQLQDRVGRCPALSGMDGTPITTVAPSTTATALTSLTTGTAPAVHGVVGYRLWLGGRTVLNVLRWRAGGSDARDDVPPEELQSIRAFGGRAAPAVTRSEFAGSGFTRAHLAGARLVGWRDPSALPVEVAALLEQGEPFVYAYYDGIDRVAHGSGLGAHYDAELAFCDHLVSQLVGVLPGGAVLVVTSDHGQVEVGDAVIRIDPELLGGVSVMSGEGRFRWLHLATSTGGGSHRLREELESAYGGRAWVRTRDEVVGEGWLGGPLSPGAASRLGDVAVVARTAVAFADPDDSGEVGMVARHGSMTAAEMHVPLLAVRG